LEIEEAISIEAAAMMLVTKNREPRNPSWRLNFLLKKYVTHGLYDVNG
jgi:hypothetical protein